MSMRLWRMVAPFVLAAVLSLGPSALHSQEKCGSCSAESAEDVLRRYQQEIERARREIARIERQLAANADTAHVRRLNSQLRRAIDQLSRTQERQAQRLALIEQRRTNENVWTVIAPGAAAAWMTQPIDGYIGVLWSASVHVEDRKDREALWTFHDYPQVEAVERGSPAEAAGILVGDVILAFDGKDLRSGRIPMNSVLRPGRTVSVRLSRDKRPRQVSVRVEERPPAIARVRTPGVTFAPTPLPAPVEPSEDAPRIAIAPAPPAAAVFGSASASATTIGAEMIALDETLGEPLGTEYGLWILRVGSGTPAARAGIHKGDVLVAVDGRELRSVSALIRAVQRSERKALRIELLRKGTRRHVELKW
jgi:membrane-associated protease RseP (regulator of RpoE activity)